MSEIEMPAGAWAPSGRPLPPRIKHGLPFFAVVATALALSSGMVTVSGAIAVGDEGPSLKLYHCVLALVGLGLLLRGRVSRVRPEMIVYFVVTLSCSFVAGFVFGVQTRPIVNAAIMVFSGVAGATLGATMGELAVVKALRLAAGLFAAAVIMKASLYVPVFVAFFAQPQGHPLIPTFCIGGPNLEATWIALASAFFLGSAWLLPYAAIALSISLLYASRVGVMIVALVLVASVLRSFAARRHRSTVRLGQTRSLALFVLLMGVGTAASLQFGDELGYVVKRFQSVGDEPGSLGRLTLWRGGVEVFARHPLGIGQGNAIPLLEHEIGSDVPENNLHNLYLQHLVETGIPGLLAYLAFGIMVWRRFAAGRYQDRLLTYVLCYLVISALQFSGGDPILWLVWGLQAGYASLTNTPTLA